jgi:uncharacterized membrane protein YqiK
MAEAALKLVETNEVEEKALSIVDQAKAVKVVDSQSYTVAGMLWKSIGDMIKEVKETFDPICEKAFAAHKEATGKRAKYLDPLTTAQKSVKSLMSAYDAEEERKRKAEEERLAAIARKEEEDRRKAEIDRLEADRKAEEDRLLAEAQAAKDRGDNDTAELLTNAAVETSESIKEQTAAIAQEPIYIAPVVAPKTTPKMAGGPVYQTRWYAEVVDIKALCMAVGSGKTNPEYVMGLVRDKSTGKISSPTLDKMAPTSKDVFPIAPGVRSYSKRV